VVDTAGWEDEDAQTLPGRMRKQTEASLEGADAALFVIDARAGLTPLDNEIARYLREQRRADRAGRQQGRRRAGRSGVLEAYSLGLANRWPCLPNTAKGVADLFGALWPIIGEKAEAVGSRARSRQARIEDEDAPLGPLKLAIVGRPNAGKSTLINQLAGRRPPADRPRSRDHPRFHRDRLAMADAIPPKIRR
jgi:GTP-binding protein